MAKNPSEHRCPIGNSRQRLIFVLCVLAAIFLVFLAGLLIWHPWSQNSTNGSNNASVASQSVGAIHAESGGTSESSRNNTNRSVGGQGQSREDSQSDSYCQVLAQTRRWVNVLHGMGVNQAVGKQAENMKYGHDLATKLEKIAPTPKERSDWQNVAQKTQLALNALDAFTNQHDFRQSMEDYGGEPNQTLRRVDDSMLQAVNGFNDTWKQQCQVDMVDHGK